MTRREGSTLLELLVAVAITGTTCTIGFAAVSFVSSPISRGADADQQRLIEVHDFLRSALRSGLATGHIEHADRTKSSRPDDELTVAMWRQYPLTDEASTVKLHITDNALGERSLVASTAHRSDVLIWPGVDAINVRFGQRIEGAIQWRESIRRSETIDAVELTLTGLSLHPLLAQPITVAR